MPQVPSPEKKEETHPQGLRASSCWPDPSCSASGGGGEAGRPAGGAAHDDPVPLDHRPGQGVGEDAERGAEAACSEPPPCVPFLCQ